MLFRSHQLAVAQIHAHQHLSPITRFVAPCSGVNRQERVVLVKLTVQECFEFERLKLFGTLSYLSINLILLLRVIRLIRIQFNKLG